VQLVPHDRDLGGWLFPRGIGGFFMPLCQLHERFCTLKQYSYDSKKKKKKKCTNSHMQIALRQEKPPPTVHPASLVLNPSDPARQPKARYYG